MTHDSRPSRSRKPTARTSVPRSPHKVRTAASCSGPEFTVTTRKIAARVSVEATGCGTSDGTLGSLAGISVLILRVQPSYRPDDLSLQEVQPALVHGTSAARIAGGYACEVDVVAV